MSTPSVYRGRSIEELIPRIQAELGSDAIVLRRRTGLSGGIGGFFQRPFAEVEAQAGSPRVDLYDEDPGTPAMPAAAAAAAVTQSAPRPQALAAYAQEQATAFEAAPFEAETAFAPEQAEIPRRPMGSYVSGRLAALAAGGSRQSFTPAATATFEPEPFTPTPVAPPESFNAALAAEMHVFEPLQAELERIEPTRTVQPPTPVMATAPPPPPSPSFAAPPAPRSRARLSLENDLIELGLSAAFARELIDAAGAHVLPLAPRLSLAKAVHSALVQSIPVCPPLPAASASIALVGSGGSGKTSCCAALLAAYRKHSTVPVSCATIVAGGEREEHSLLLSPLLMTPTPLSSAAAGRALASVRAQGLLLLDTPALSPADRAAVRRLTGLLGELRPDRIVVALPATLGAKAAAQLLEALAPLGASAVVITHADETDQLGVAVEAACKFGLAPEFIVERGRARAGLSRIDPTYLADRLLP